MISIVDKVADTANNSGICGPLVLEMAKFQLEVSKNADVIFFPFKYTDPLTFTHRSL